MILRLATWAGPFQDIPRDTLPDQPLPGGIADVVRFFFHVPQWIQIGGAILAAVVGAGVATLAWRHREALWRWLRTRRTALQVALVAVLTVAVVGGAWFGAESWDYMQHDNAFCTGCHVMGPAFRKFAESEHAELQCHDCHRQSIFASARQLYLWVLDRPEEIGEHAPVPNRVCADCHVRERPDSVWQRIAATAGHRVHLESDREALAEVMCVTCHGLEVHRFVPADRTCGQSGCHSEAETRIVLGRMAAEQTALHCVTCHDFTAPVPERTAVDTAFARLAPGGSQCLSCHEMRGLLASFEPGADPHDARCGLCHDPHVQEVPEQALATCTEAGCHAEPETLTGFHRGIGGAVLADCGSCHPAHEWVVDGSDCGACHTQIAGAREASSPRRPSAGGEAGRSRRVSAAHRWRTSVPDPSAAGSGARGPSAGDPVPGPRSRGPAGGALQESRFRHADHRDVRCTACHSSEERHGVVTVSAGDCFSCHHRPRALATGCGGCHRAEELGGRMPVRQSARLSVWEGVRQRTMPFRHAAHEEVACGECHRGSGTLAANRPCADCHEPHHRPETSCMACHPAPSPEAHTVAVHVGGCGGSGCHEEAAHTEMQPTRSFCLACHQDRPGPDHEPGQACHECHRVPLGGDRPAAGLEGS